MNTNYGLATEKSEKRRSTPLLLVGYVLLLAILALGASEFVTLQVAKSYGYHKVLGHPWFAEHHIYAPWAWLEWQRRLGDSYGVIAAAERKGEIVFAVPMMVFLFAMMLRNSRLRKRQDLHGSARWAVAKEIKQMGLLNGAGVYVGGWQDKQSTMYLRHNGPEHIIVYAPTRSGKGVGLVLPTLLSWPDSTLVLDIKGENWSLTSGFRQSQGQKVLKFDPTCADDTGAAYNPLEEVRLDTIHAIPDAQNIASMIVDPDGQGLKDYWNKAAFSFLGGALLHCLLTIHKNQNRTATLYDLSCMLADKDRDIQEVFQTMLDTDHVALLKACYPNCPPACGQALNTFITASAREMLNKAESELSGVVSTAGANLALYRDPVVAANTSACDFRINDLMNNDVPVSLYLVVRPSDIDRLRPLIRLIVNIIMRRLTERMEFSGGRSVAGYKHRLLLMLDEFASLGKLEIFEKSLAYMAGYGIKTYIIVQDITQLRAAYGKDESITSNCHIRSAFAPNQYETARMLSDMTGKATVVEEKVSLSGSRTGPLRHTNVSVSETARNLLTPDECMRLPGSQKDAEGQILEAGDMLIFVAGFSPIYGRQLLYFKDPIFMQRASQPSPACSDYLCKDDDRKSRTWLKIENKTAENKAEKPAQSDAKTEIIYDNFLKK